MFHLFRERLTKKLNGWNMKYWHISAFLQCFLRLFRTIINVDRKLKVCERKNINISIAVHVNPICPKSFIFCFAFSSAYLDRFLSDSLFNNDFWIMLIWLREQAWLIFENSQLKTEQLRSIRQIWFSTVSFPTIMTILKSQFWNS